MVESLGECLNTNSKVVLYGLGTFVRKRRKAKTMVSHLPGQTVHELPERWVLRYIPSGIIRQTVTIAEAKELGMKLPTRDAEDE